MSDEKKRASSKRTRGVIDRIEDGTAVVMFGDDEDKSVDLPAALLPAGASDGDHLNINITLDAESRKKTEESVKALQEKLEQRGGAQEQKSFKL